MLSFSLQPLFLQLPLYQAGQLLLVTGIVFAVITLIVSIVRFHQLIMTEGHDLTSVEDCNNFFHIQVARYLSKINRESNGFGIVIVQFQSAPPDQKALQENVWHLLQGLIRSSCDTACLFHEDCVAAILDAEEETLPFAAERILKDLKKAVASIPEITALRAGFSSFPTHGMKSQLLIEAAISARDAARFDSECPPYIASEPDPESRAPDDEEDDDVGAFHKRSKRASLDPLTGVLKPEAIGSYMRKYLSDIRQKQEPATALCIGINRIDHITALHGEEAADAAIAGVCTVLKRLTRNSDLIGRFLRDDFFILAPCSLQEGEMIANRLREAVLQEVILFEGRRLKTSICIGIASHPEHGRALRHLFEGSHAALSVIREWETTSCLVYDPEKHKKHHEK